MIKDIPFPDIGAFSVVDGTDFMRQLEEGWCYEKAIWSPFFSLFKPGVFIDVGANWGYWTCLSSIYGATKCIAVEPSPVNHRLLCRNISRLHIPVLLLPFFAGEKYGWGTCCRKLEEKENNYNVAEHTEMMDNGNWIVPLDDFVRERITGIKIDVEGYETAVFRGLQNTIKRFLPIITCEFHYSIIGQYHFDIAEVPLFLLELGYSLHWLQSNNTFTKGFTDYNEFLVAGNDIQSNQIISGQFIARPKDAYAELH